MRNEFLPYIPGQLPGRGKPSPHALVAYDRFVSNVHISKPYLEILQKSSDRICNYRLWRARRVVEKNFGLLASVLRVEPIQTAITCEFGTC